MTTHLGFSPLLADFAPLDLNECEPATLQGRVDTKFLVPTGQLAPILGALRSDYRTLRVRGQNVQRYQTLYLDTDGLALYLMHHNGQAKRVKVRKRWYVDSGTSFLEVKQRSEASRTTKVRRALERDEHARDELLAWLRENSPIAPEELHPRTWTQFDRIALLNEAREERITIDHGLSFKVASPGDETVEVPDSAGFRSLANELCVVEVKQRSRSAGSIAIDALAKQRLYPTPFSKYCVGTALLYPEVKRGALLPLLRTVGDLT